MGSSHPSGTAQTPRRKRSKIPLLVALGILIAAGLFALIASIRTAVEKRAAHNLVNPVPATPQVLAVAKDSYDSHCASCHGSRGDGRGDKADGLWSKPTDFRDTAHMARATDGDLYWVTTKGDWPMPAFESRLSNEDRWELVNYIRTFAKQ